MLNLLIFFPLKRFAKLSDTLTKKKSKYQERLVLDKPNFGRQVYVSKRYIDSNFIHKCGTSSTTQGLQIRFALNVQVLFIFEI